MTGSNLATSPPCFARESPASWNSKVKIGKNECGISLLHYGHNRGYCRTFLGSCECGYQNAGRVNHAECLRDSRAELRWQEREGPSQLNGGKEQREWRFCACSYGLLSRVATTFYVN